MEKIPDRILLAHGGGGILMRELIEEVVKRIGSADAPSLQDSAIVEIDGSRIAFTTDSFVVSPIFFPGGDIGTLSIYGTVNDLAVSGARPIAVSLAFIVEEGFPMESLERVADSIRSAADRAGVSIVTGDTKVVEKGKADGIYINTSGIGVVPDGVSVSTDAAKAGDVIIVNGNIGEHGLAIASKREGIDFGVDIESDSAPLSELIIPMLEQGFAVRAMRDATRGGLAAVLNEIASDSGVGMVVDEAQIPIPEAVLSGCELMGYEPLNIANEGKFVAVVDGSDAERVVEFMRSRELGRNAALIGEVVSEHPGTVVMKTIYGGQRVVDVPYGDLLPRIC